MCRKRRNVKRSESERERNEGRKRRCSSRAISGHETRVPLCPRPKKASCWVTLASFRRFSGKSRAAVAATAARFAYRCRAGGRSARRRPKGLLTRCVLFFPLLPRVRGGRSGDVHTPEATGSLMKRCVVPGRNHATGRICWRSRRRAPRRAAASFSSAPPFSFCCQTVFFVCVCVNLNLPERVCCATDAMHCSATS